MKNVRSLLFVVYWCVAQNTLAQKNDSSELLITGSRFAYPLIEKWIEAYKSINPALNIRIVSKSDTADLIFKGHEIPKEELTPEWIYVNLARYVIVPIAHVKSDFALHYGEKGLDKQEVQKLFFEDEFKTKDNEKSEKINYTFYARQQKSCIPSTFAGYYGYVPSDFKGKGISGADQHLVVAVQNDQTAVSYAPLNYAFDLNKRSPVEKISILPLDLNNNRRLESDEKIFENLDTALDFLEAEKTENLPGAYLHVGFPEKVKNPNLVSFLIWILNEGQQYNHNAGFLKLEEVVVTKEQKKLDNLLKELNKP
ncbi:MAG: hypothetical protein NW226_22905 [Microscillaceae bacterium]|nr:hypothetical protein [Microscillaceae bacterium]